MLFGDPGPPGAGLSVAVVVLLVLATMAADRLPAPAGFDAGAGPDRRGRVPGDRARICQARDQHQALYRLLSRQPPP
jgi:hypothetical protein